MKTTNEFGQDKLQQFAKQQAYKTMTIEQLQVGLWEDQWEITERVIIVTGHKFNEAHFRKAIKYLSFEQGILHVNLVDSEKM